jgi:protein SCO1/2
MQTNRWKRAVRGCLLLGILFLTGIMNVFAQQGGIVQDQGQVVQQLPGVDIKKVRIDQKLDSPIPLNTTFRDETGQTIKIGDYFNEKPVVLVFAYYECPMLCTVVLNELTRVLKVLQFSPGKEFEVITVSISPTETPELAASKKANYIEHLGRENAGKSWHFLTGEEDQIKKLADAVGFQYVYDPKTKQYAHSAGLMILTPKGKLARYFYGIDYSAKDLRFALIEASQNKIGTPVDQVFLYCYQYDPSTGKYGLIILRVVQLAGIATALSLGTFIYLMLRWEKKGRFANPPMSGAGGASEIRNSEDEE